MIPRKLDRLESFDARSKMFMVRRKVKGQEPIPKLWDCKIVLDQKNEGSCVGHGCAHRLIAAPVEMLWVDHNYAVKIYKRAQFLDDFPGEDYEGTSVLGGLKMMREAGLCTGWTWAFSTLDAQLGISYQGPGVAGLNWKTGMFDTDSEGYIHATGYTEGGHCVAVIGFDLPKQAFIILNSWGPQWGRNGRAFLSCDDYEKLLSGAEMAFIEGEVDPQSPPPDPEPEKKGCSLARTWVGLGNSLARAVGSRTQIEIRR
jgi:hypothetical protein